MSIKNQKRNQRFNQIGGNNKSIKNLTMKKTIKNMNLFSDEPSI